MLLYDIFLDIDAGRVSSSLHEVTLSRQELELSLKKATACYRTLTQPNRVAAYRYFLEHCKKAMQEHESKPLLPILLDMLVDDCPLPPKVICEALTKLYFFNTQFQKNPLEMASMGEALIARPIAFVAFLRCLIKHGVGVQPILKTHLLHQFFRYHLSTIGCIDNPLANAFELLSVFSDTKPLSDAARKISSKERGFEAYALDGYISLDLVSIQKEVCPIRFTPDLTNLRALHTIFGSDFLYASLIQWQAQKSNNIWMDYITDLFNRTDIVEEQLPALLGRLLDNAPLQQALAEILNMQTLGFLITKGHENILCLIPFCPNIVQVIQHHDLMNFLQNIRQRSTSGIALIEGLLTIFENIKHANKSMQLLVFHHLLNAVINEPYVLEDDVILRKIRIYALKNNCISDLASSLKARLDDVMTQQIQKGLEGFDIIAIEDMWRQTAIKIRALQEIISFNSEIPLDKYSLYVQLALNLHEKYGHLINLQTLSAIFGVTPSFSDNIVTEYERFIIEMLTAIDNDLFRQECITLLNKQHISRNWRTYEYGQLDLFQRAIRAGNLSFIQWLHAENIRPTVPYDTLMILAARNNQWYIVCFLYNHHNPEKKTINVLLHMAVEQDAAEAIKLVWAKCTQLPTPNEIEQSLQLAIKKNSIDSIRNILDCFKAPTDKTMAQAFKLAVHLQHYGAAITLATYHRKKLLTSATDDALIRASRLGHSELVNGLILLSRLPIIETAFLAAVRSNNTQAVRCFLDKSIGKIPRTKVIKRAWNEAKKHQHHELIECLSSYCDTQINHLPSQDTQEPPQKETNNVLLSQSLFIPKLTLKRAMTYDETRSKKKNIIGFFSSATSSNLLSSHKLTRSISFSTLEYLEPRQ